GSNLAQGFQTFSQDPKTLDESLALIIGDLSPSSASAHMNYLITLLKSYRRASPFDVVRMIRFFYARSTSTDTFLANGRSGSQAGQ
ncbi:hypothetical protein, partial [Halomonas sp. CSM-2]|uniref:hypothetical protein n=1 Tax=Halomonas sp. CSM-2 TaxID=1975722 RepID=UPI001C37EBBE